MSTTRTSARPDRLLFVPLVVLALLATSSALAQDFDCEGYDASMAPTADAGFDRGHLLLQTVRLDGRGSSSPVFSDDELSYSWSFVVNDDSTPILEDADTPRPRFVSSVPDTFLLSLVVSDPCGGVSSDTVVVGVENAADIIATFVATQEHVDSLPASDFVAGERGRRRLLNSLDRAIERLGTAACNVSASDRSARTAIRRTAELIDGVAARGAVDPAGPVGIQEDIIINPGSQLTAWETMVPDAPGQIGGSCDDNLLATGFTSRYVWDSLIDTCCGPN